jgi:hypothetical protein
MKEKARVQTQQNSHNEKGHSLERPNLTLIQQTCLQEVRLTACPSPATRRRSGRG